MEKKILSFLSSLFLSLPHFLSVLKQNPMEAEIYSECISPVGNALSKITKVFSVYCGMEMKWMT